MRPGQIGGLLLIAACVLYLGAIGLAAAGGDVGIGLVGASSILVLGALVLGGIGCAVVASSGPPPLAGRGVRTCLGMLAVGLLSLTAGSFLAGISTTDPLASGPIVALLLIGLCATLVGVVATAVTLVLEPTPTRLAGSVMFIGIASFVLAVVIARGTGDDSAHTLTAILGTVGSVLVLLGGIWVGIIVFNGIEPEAAA